MRLIIKHNKDVNPTVGEKMYLTEGMVLQVTSIVANVTPQKTICEGEILIDFLTEKDEEEETEDVNVIVPTVPSDDVFEASVLTKKKNKKGVI